ncbi:hypothetical protein [Yinghuangia aomiensis]|uniref:hypothetical protein n=1 Tax=Yinghuangia aomiensis TaxID=676205 RepID=UPI0031E8B162
MPQNATEFLDRLALGTYALEPFDREQLAELAGRWFGDTPSGRLRAQSFLHQSAHTGVRELSRGRGAHPGEPPFDRGSHGPPPRHPLPRRPRHRRRPRGHTLRALSPAYPAEAATRLRTLALDPRTPPRARVKAAHGLSNCSRHARRGIPDVLRALVADPATPPCRRREAARALGKFGSDNAREAAGVLFALADAAGPRTYARRAALRTATHLGLGFARQAPVRFDAPASSSECLTEP